ncbi:hypothetical protein [Mechercharimyces sp. CAU 1602]|uniref:hypothetical protein n=1 Tax=Mechercharimyces sp. CAU 1602 TaxID=2973933 RepID=UPI0021635B93|nr:hypothetical protein [Mechercharimyces sp. CAU 1602]MCS1352107.1 hypothetical protein [Mechercharimyces sp. CAU 1602]
MSEFQIFITLALLLIVIFSILLTRKFHNSLHHNQRMVISMISGTSIGLVIGLMLASMFQGNLFISTVSGMSVGAFIGGICNWRLGMVSCIEGLSAGMMGGMMGAMLGEMMTVTESIILIKLFITLALCSLFLYPVLASTSCADQSITSRKWFIKPLLVFVLVISFLLGGDLIVDEPMNDQGPHNHHSN